MRYYLFVLIIIISVSCSTEKLEYGSDFEKYLAQLPDIPIQEKIIIDGEDFPVYTPFKMSVASEGNIVVADGSNFTLHLLNPNGEHINSAGRMGRGPGEFQLINQIHLGEDNRLYVYDGRAQRISIFTIDEESFQFEEVVNLPNYKTQTPKSIYPTDNGFIGVFKALHVSRDQEPEFEVYSLTNDFQIEKRIFTMHGNEYYYHNGSRKDNPMGFSTIWGWHKNSLYYSHTDDFSATSVNTSDNSIKEFNITGIPESKIGEKQVEFINERLGPFQMDPEVEESIRKGEPLPYFLGFIPGENHLYFSLFNASHDPGFVLEVNKESKEIRKIEVPSVFNLYAVEDEKLYGIDHSDDRRHKIMILEI